MSLGIRTEVQDCGVGLFFVTFMAFLGLSCRRSLTSLWLISIVVVGSLLMGRVEVRVGESVVFWERVRVRVRVKEFFSWTGLD